MAAKKAFDGEYKRVRAHQIVLEMNSYHIPPMELILRSIRWHQRFIHFINFLLECAHAHFAIAIDPL